MVDTQTDFPFKSAADFTSAFEISANGIFNMLLATITTGAPAWLERTAESKFVTPRSREPQTTC